MTKSHTTKFIEALQVCPPWLRKLIGILLICLGFLGFLPIIGFWMIPLGLIVLSADYRFARAIYVRSRLVIHRYKKKRRRAAAAKHQRS